MPETHSPLTTHQSAMTNIASSITGPKSIDSGLQCPSALPSGSTQQQPIVPDVIIPIVLGSIPPTHPDYSPSRRNNSVKEGYMILHERKLILDPDVFSELTPEMLSELERMGARAALTVLTGHMVRALKEKRASERGKGREKGLRRGRGGRKGATNVVSNTQCLSRSPFTEALLERAEVTARSANIGDGRTREESQSTEDEPREEGSISVTPAEPGSPIIVVVDSEDEGPVSKKRKVDNDKESARSVPDGTAPVPGII
jgi:forkhead box protein K